MYKFFLSSLFILALVNTKTGDHYPFCLKPEKYPTSLQVLPGKLNTNKLLGYWYEIMLSTNLVEKESKCGKLILTPKEDSSIEMDLQYLMNDDSWKTVTAKADFTNEEKTKMLFSSESLSLQQFWFLDFSEDEQFIVLGEPCRLFFWVFGKTTDVTPDFILKRIQFLIQINYPPSKMVYRDKNCSSKFF